MPTPTVPDSPATALDLPADKIHDPRLLAVLGLYAHDAGSNKKAREFLSAAAYAKVERPRVYFVLSELRLKQALARPEGTDGKISSSQAEAALIPLRQALRPGASTEVYRLLVDIWANSDARPSEHDAAELEAGVDEFPRDSELTYNTALICARAGYPQLAATIIDKAILFSASDENRQHFLVLRATLDVPGK
jgi:hypothetical protein